MSADLEPNYGRRMTNAEAVLLCRYAKAACPQQAFDQYTPDAWSDLLGDLRFEDCKEALRNIVQRQPFVAPAEIRTEVKRVRNKRIGDFGPLPDPPIGTDYTEAEYRRFIADTMRRIGDGELVSRDDMPEFERRDVIAELGQVGQPVDLDEMKREVRARNDAAREKIRAREAEASRRRDERQAEVERMRAAEREARPARCDRTHVDLTTPTPTTEPEEAL